MGGQDKVQSGDDWENIVASELRITSDMAGSIGQWGVDVGLNSTYLLRL